MPMHHTEQINRYEVLTTDLLKTEDRTKLATDLAKFAKPLDVVPLVNAPGSRYYLRTVDSQGRIVLLTWKGVEAMLFFRRDVKDLDVGFGPTPARYLRDPSQAWITVNLLTPDSPSYDQELLAKYQSLAARASQLEGTIRRLQEGASQKEASLEKEAMQVKLALQEKDETIAKLKQKLRKAQQRAVRMSGP